MIKMGLWKCCLHCWNGSPKKWWNLPCWLFFNTATVSAFELQLCMSDRERVQILCGSQVDLKHLTLWLYWGSKRLVATCKTPEFVEVPIMSACDSQDGDVEEDYFESEGGSQSSRSPRSSLWGHLKKGWKIWWHNEIFYFWCCWWLMQTSWIHTDTILQFMCITMIRWSSSTSAYEDGNDCHT